MKIKGDSEAFNGSSNVHAQPCMCAVCTHARVHVSACRQHVSAKLVGRHLTDLHMQKTEHPQFYAKIGCSGKCDPLCLGSLSSILHEATDYFTIKLSGNMLESVLM